MNIIVAVYSDWGIGSVGTQPMVIPGDRRRFAELTAGGTVIAGRKTLADLPGGAPLQGRRNFVISRTESCRIEGAIVVHSLEDLLAGLYGTDLDTVFVIGGGEVYRLLLPYCRRAYITKIDAKPLCDTFFPNLDATPGWILAEKGNAFLSDGISYSHNLYENKYPKIP